MGIPEWIAVASVIIALASLTFEQHLSRRQSKAEALDKYSDRTQTLLLKALDDPELLAAISGNSEGDQKQRRFRQLWFNHAEMFYRNRRLFDRVHRKGSLHDFQSFLNMPVMRLHWDEHRKYYANDFQTFMEKEIMLKGTEASTAKPPPLHDQASST